MSVFRCSPGRPPSGFVPGVSAFVAACALLFGCHGRDDHPPFAAGCETGCEPQPGISLGAGSGSKPPPPPDAGGATGDLTGQVLLLRDATFVNSSLYNRTAVVSATGPGATTVTAVWDGADPYELQGVAALATNWLSVKPDEAQGDALETFQAVATQSVRSADLAVVSATTLDDVFNSIATLRSPEFAQVVLFFRSSATNAALSGVHVSMPSAQVAAYATSNGWVEDDGTATTGATGLVFFGNVELNKAKGTQTVTVTKPATATGPAAAGVNFSVRVVDNAATIARVNVEL